jgi:hypothetical protein
MHEKLNKVRKENPNFDRELVNSFAKNMPDLLSILIDGSMYDNHIGSKDVAMLAEQFITDDKGEHIGFRWDYETIINTAKNYIDLNETEFYPTDLWVWANVKYGDMSHITTDTQTIIRYAIAELSDDDFPFYPASQRAYCWLKKHIENES